MTQQLIECVPNFSEGRDLAVIKQITDKIEAVDGVSLLDVDPGQTTNRTVATFVGPPEAVIEAAVSSARKATELIDMAKHHGKHPRFGSMDVCPIVPFADISMDQTILYAHKLARRLGDEVGLTIYCYDCSATTRERCDLSVIRAGEYEGLARKLQRPEWKPDFGPNEFNVRSGATAVGARNFLIAYNVNLNTTSSRCAQAIASDLREKGRKKRKGDAYAGPIVKDADGNSIWLSGKLECVKGIGWFIQEYGLAQVSLNLTNVNVTPMHVAFDECTKAAETHGVQVTGSEVVGLIPLNAMLEAGRHFLKKKGGSISVSDAELIKFTIQALKLDELYPFKPAEKIIEYAVAVRQSQVKQSVDESFSD